MRAMLPRITPFALLAMLALAGCQTPAGVRLNHSLAALRANPQNAHAQAAYRKAAAELLPDLVKSQPTEKVPAGYYSPAQFSGVDVIRGGRATRPGLHRTGFGLPVIGVISQQKSGDPNAPRAGFQVPATAFVLPGKSGGFVLKLVDPDKVARVKEGKGTVPVAMDLEAPINSARAAGPRFLDGIRYLLRADKFVSRRQLGFLEPYDPDKTPVIFVHGLLSTPSMWEPVLKQLMASKKIRDRYQFWFFYYPTGQPVPASALQLREALDAAVAWHHVDKPMILVGHSMGGILSRAQVSSISEAEAEAAAGVPWIVKVPHQSMAYRALVFQPRPDIEEVIFLNTPHRGSRMALTGFAGIAIQLIRLPSNVLNELKEFAEFVIPDGRGRMPTSIQGLSPDSPFLRMLNLRPPGVPHHTVLGDRGRGDSPNSSDGVVPYSSAHLDSAQSELIVPGGHGSFSHPKSVREMERILLESK